MKKMEQLRMQPLPRNDGAYLLVSGLGPPFRFRLGEGDIHKMDHPSAYMWSVKGAIGTYLLQFIAHQTVSDPSVGPLQILAGHFKWESEFARKNARLVVDESKVGLTRHLSGSPVLRWVNFNPSLDPAGSVTPFAAQVTLLHAPKFLLHFSVTGAGADWSEEDVAVQALRAALSYFPLPAQSGNP
jgi:hypothetical protein